MKDYEIILNELKSKGYSLLRFNIGENDFGPFEDTVKSIQKALMDSEPRISLAEKPKIIKEDDKDLADGTYLVEENPLITSVYVHKGNSWFIFNL